MKIIGIILSFLVLILSIMPCSDKAAPQAGQQVRYELTGQSTHHSLPAQDDCSPFCHCACCALSAVVAPVAILDIRPALPGKVFHSVYCSSIRALPRAIWQPPQLS